MKYNKDTPNVELRWDNVSVTAGKGDEEKSILKGVTGRVRQGSVMAIMGSSGAGKSTLMNILTRRNIQGLRIDGNITVNGVNVKEDISKLSGYIQQNDVFVGALSVEEHLFLQAKLRLSKETKQRQEDRVQEVVQLMGLQKCYKTVIGTPGLTKTISGGEMKRLSFASEILTDPPIIFADEPTSGLDSYLAMAVVNTLKDLAANGSTILCTIHQPSSEIFRQFDSLCLLSMGKCAYNGPLNGAKDFFSRVGFPCEENYNPADHYIWELSVIEGREMECEKKIDAICAAFDKSTEKTSMANEKRISDKQVVKEKINEYNKNSVSFFVSFYWLLWRSLIAQYRDKATIGMKFGQNLGTALIVGLVYLRVPWDSRINPYEEVDAFNINGAIFSLVCSFSFTYLFLVVFAFPRMQVVLRREYYDGLYKLGTAFMAEIIAGIPFLLAMPFFFVGIQYCMVGMAPGWSAYFSVYLTCILIALSATGYGYMISALAPTVEAANALAPPLMVPLLLFGGFFLQSDSVPPYFIWLKYISWFYYGAENLYVTQWREPTGACFSLKVPVEPISEATRMLYNLLPDPAADECKRLIEEGIIVDNEVVCDQAQDNVDGLYCQCLQAQSCVDESQNPVTLYQYRSGKDILAPFSYKEEYYWRNVGCLLALAVGFRLVGYLVLAFKFRKANR